MGNFWLKVKLWSKSIVFGLIGLYVLLFMAFNWNVRVQGDLDFVFTKFRDSRILAVLFFTAVLSVVGWWLFRTVLTTIRQFKEMRQRNLTSRLEKDLAEMKAKAGMLQSKDSSTPAPTVARVISPDE